jgi:hypothetical protein
VEEAGLDIEEHAERAYADEDELGKIWPKVHSHQLLHL